MDPANQFPSEPNQPATNPVDSTSSTPRRRPTVFHEFCLLGPTKNVRVFDKKFSASQDLKYPFVRFTRNEIQIGCSTIEIEAAQYLLDEHKKWLDSINNAEKIL